MSLYLASRQVTRAEARAKPPVKRRAGVYGAVFVPRYKRSPPNTHIMSTDAADEVSYHATKGYRWRRYA